MIKSIIGRCPSVGVTAKMVKSRSVSVFVVFY